MDVNGDGLPELVVCHVDNPRLQRLAAGDGIQNVFEPSASATAAGFVHALALNREAGAQSGHPKAS